MYIGEYSIWDRDERMSTINILHLDASDLKNVENSAGIIGNLLSL